METGKMVKPTVWQNWRELNHKKHAIIRSLCIKWLVFTLALLTPVPSR